jgi:hypothetical protein
MASINCVTGAVTGTLVENADFTWTNPNTSGSCLVSNVGGWCKQSSYTVPQATSATQPGSISAKTKDVTGSDFSFTCPCYNVPGQPKITIGAK